MKRIIIENVTAKDMDVLTSEPESFNLVTKSEVRRIGSFDKRWVGKYEGWNDYFFTKAKQMRRRNSV